MNTLWACSLLTLSSPGWLEGPEKCVWFVVGHLQLRGIKVFGFGLFQASENNQFNLNLLNTGGLFFYQIITTMFNSIKTQCPNLTGLCNLTFNSPLKFEGTF